MPQAGEGAAVRIALESMRYESQDSIKAGDQRKLLNLGCTSFDINDAVSEKKSTQTCFIMVAEFL